ncbi:MAG: restriction endonuclease, partial [Acidobacteriota bacterium]
MPVKKTGSRSKINKARGQLAARKGKTFENQVAELFRLQGFEVIQNVQICNKKVDMLAVFRLPGSTSPHRVIVECKNEKVSISQNQRVMQFSGLLVAARKAGEAEAAEIITATEWGDAAKGFARNAGVGLQTYGHKVRQLIDFDFYLRGIKRKFEESTPERTAEPALARYYVEPAVSSLVENKSKPIPSLERYVLSWLEQTDSLHLAVVGEYGTGKTSFCQKLAHKLATARLANPEKYRIPILFNLRDFT